jgi:hypothetical protein
MSNVPQWWITDRNDRVLAGPFTSEENAEPVAIWIRVLDRDNRNAAAAYGVRLPDGAHGALVAADKARPLSRSWRPAQDRR